VLRWRSRPGDRAAVGTATDVAEAALGRRRHASNGAGGRSHAVVATAAVGDRARRARVSPRMTPMRPFSLRRAAAALAAANARGEQERVRRRTAVTPAPAPDACPAPSPAASRGRKARRDRAPRRPPTA